MYTADKGITIQRQQRAASIKLIKYIGKDTPRNINFYLLPDAYLQGKTYKLFIASYY
jgi:hypothetical protein